MTEEQVSANTLKLNAYTDASISEEGEATSVIMLVGNKGRSLHSVHLINFGFQKVRNIVKFELDTKIAAMVLAPKKSLNGVVSDSEGSVLMLKTYAHTSRLRKLRHHLSDEDISILDQALNHQPEVDFYYLSRKKYIMRLTDNFSRLARGQDTGCKSYIGAKGKTLSDQVNMMYQQISAEL